MTTCAPPVPKTPPSAWWLVLGLVGVDYFSTLAYLPAIAVQSAGSLAPLAALLIVAVTLGLALPVYAYVVGRSPHGEGGTGLLEHLVHGWIGKLLILVLLGFVATDFVITRTLSASDASAHIIHGPEFASALDRLTLLKHDLRTWWPSPLTDRILDYWDRQLIVTVLLSLLGFGFWWVLQNGFTKSVLRLTAVAVGFYLLLTAFIVGSGLYALVVDPLPFHVWWANILERHANGGFDNGRMFAGKLLVWGLLSFPQMALGLSGFELSMAVAPLVRGDPHDDPVRPLGRIRNTRKLLVAAALIMALFIPASVLVTTLFVPPATLGGDSLAAHRALAYLAHGGLLTDGQPASQLNPMFGVVFGGIYDLSTILILCLAGASVSISLRDLVPQFLHRFGMQLEWARRVGLILHLFNIIILLVTVVFRASVSAQQWAYATSVLVLLTSASFAAVLDVEQRCRPHWYRRLAVAPFLVASAFFLSMALLTMLVNRSGLVIAFGFVAVIVSTSAYSRWRRSTELRFEGFTFADEASSQRWHAISQLEFQVLVPHRPGRHSLADKNRDIRSRHRLTPDVPIIFIEAELGDPSDFQQTPLMRITMENGMEIIRVSRCVSIAHVVAAIGLAFSAVGKPPEIIFGWSGESPLAANFNFLLLGQGNVPWMVYELVRKAEPDPARQPRIVIG